MFDTQRGRRTKKQLDNINQKFIDFQNKTKQAPEIMSSSYDMPKGPYNSDVGSGMMKKNNKDKMEGGFAWLPLVMSLVVPAIVPVVTKVVEKMIGSGKMSYDDLSKLKGGAMEGEAMYMKGGSDYLGMAKKTRGRKTKMMGGVQLMNRPSTQEMPASRMSGGCCDSDEKIIVVGGAKKGMKTKKQQTDKMKKRSDMVRKLMKEQGMTLGGASKYIKENNLLD